MQVKKITIVQGNDKLLNDAYSDRFRDYVASKLRKRNIELVLGEYVNQFPSGESGELVFKSGKKMNAGLVVSSFLVSVPNWCPSSLIFQPGPHFWADTKHSDDRRVAWAGCADGT